MNFTAIDFETASRQRSSACALALVVVRNNQIEDELSSLINPQTKFNWQNTKVNGLRARDVENAPTFPQLWPTIEPFFKNDRLIVAHNANFDNGVLCDSVERYRLKQPRYLTLDTLKATRKLYPSFPNYRLETVCQKLRIPLKNHHNALSDSLACARILIHEQQRFGNSLLRPLVQVIN